jgi:delta-aminolevulinic acid dehydratase/porphobilinogen synthase
MRYLRRMKKKVTDVFLICNAALQLYLSDGHIKIKHSKDEAPCVPVLVSCSIHEHNLNRHRQ